MNEKKMFYKVLLIALFILFSTIYIFKFFVMLSVLQQIIAQIISNFYIVNLLPGLILMSIYGIGCLIFLYLNKSFNTNREWQKIRS